MEWYGVLVCKLLLAVLQLWFVLTVPEDFELLIGLDLL